MITLETYLMGRDKIYPKEYTHVIRANAEVLLILVNDLLYQLQIDAEVSSGWRPPSYNKTVKGAAKGSKHMTGQAIDLRDPKKDIARMVCGEDFNDPGILEEFNLYAESPKATANWIHLQCVPPKSGRRIFLP